MPAVIRFLADWNPVSAVAGATRNLFGNPNPQALQDAWPCQHPVAAAIFWSLLMLAVCIPVAARSYRKRTAD
jgi:ABC-2 type transport system permease protein